MGNESFQAGNYEKTFDRANKTMEIIRSGACKTVPEAVRKVLINERITFEPDVKRIQSEVASLLNQWKEEHKIWDQIYDEDRRDGAIEAETKRGGDPQD